MSFFCCYKDWTWTILGVLAFFLLYKIFRQFKLHKLKRDYFKDKCVLITGASSGLGRALAEELYPLGAQLILCARNFDELTKLKNELMKNKGKEPEIMSFDVTWKSDVIKSKIDSLLAKFNQIDVLINNAGVTFRGESIHTTDEVYQQIMDVNYFGLVRLSNILTKHMIENSEKSHDKSKKRIYSIVNIGSVSSYIGTPYRTAYSASKHAVLAFADSLRAELYAYENIDVVNVQPGYINTNIYFNALTSDGTKINKNDENHKDGYSANYVALKCIEAILKRDKEVLVTILAHKAIIWIRFFTPEIFYFILRKIAVNSPEKKFN